MIPKEIVRNVRHIQIITTRAVTNVFAGEYRSVFKGSGIEFNEVREYLPGDDIRTIDWNVTARMDKPYIKEFVEEREMTVMLLLDIFGSSTFGSLARLKGQVAAEHCSLLAFSAITNKDKVGLILFTDKIEKFVPPRKGMSHVLRVIREALYFSPASKGTSIAGALEYLSKVMHRKTITFIISDFYDKDFTNALTVANKRHDVIAVTITDPLERELPNAGLMSLYDSETGKEFVVDSSSAGIRAAFKKNAAERFLRRQAMFNAANVDNIDIRTDVPYTRSLYTFFKYRARRMRQ
ncbi:MAG: DUF58 domain-containing protein [Candidatus Omnitrophica bacterium]|nr:DUF58 domain-containing protein [Candidatus Omnitrophota bacterium]